MEIKNNTIKFEDLKDRELSAAVVSDEEPGFFTIAVSHNQKQQIRLDGKIPDDKKITNKNLMGEAQKILVHWIFEKEGMLSDFDISQRKFMDLIKYNTINTMFIIGEEYIVQSKNNKGDCQNLIIGKEEIREEIYLANGGSMGSILYDPFKNKYLDEETRKEYERVNQSINGMNEIFEIMSEKLTDYKVNKKELWRDVKEEYDLDSNGDFLYSYGDEVVVDQETEEEIEVSDDIKERFFDNLVEQSANKKMIRMFHQLLTKKERKVIEISKDIESKYDRLVDDINTDTGEIIFREE